MPSNMRQYHFSRQHYKALTRIQSVSVIWVPSTTMTTIWIAIFSPKASAPRASPSPDLEGKRASYDSPPITLGMLYQVALDGRWDCARLDALHTP